ncbi:unnamed protein product [Leuciscus chuanchicus]
MKVLTGFDSPAWMYRECGWCVWVNAYLSFPNLLPFLWLRAPYRMGTGLFACGVLPAKCFFVIRSSQISTLPPQICNGTKPGASVTNCGAEFTAEMKCHSCGVSVTVRVCRCVRREVEIETGDKGAATRAHLSPDLLSGFSLVPSTFYLSPINTSLSRSPFLLPFTFFMPIPSIIRL